MYIATQVWKCCRFASLQVSELLAAVDTSGATATMFAAENEKPEALDTILQASMTLLDDEVTRRHCGSSGILLQC